MNAMHGPRIVRWADDAGIDETQRLSVALGIRPETMLPGPGTGESLVSNGLLIVVGGQGTITVDGAIHPTRAGEIYMVEGTAPHAVGAITDHVLLAVGAPHVPVSSPDRMSAVPYRALTAHFDDLHCLICQIHAVYPRVPHELGCPHCPCVACSTRGA